MTATIMSRMTDPRVRLALMILFVLASAVLLGSCNEGGWSQEGDDVTWRH